MDPAEWFLLSSTTAQLLGSPAHEDLHVGAQQEEPGREPFTRSLEWGLGGATFGSRRVISGMPTYMLSMYV